MWETRHVGDAPARTKVGGASDGAAGALAFHASLNVALSFVHSHTGSLGLAAVTRLPEAGEGATSKAVAGQSPEPLPA